MPAAGVPSDVSLVLLLLRYSACVNNVRRAAVLLYDVLGARRNGSLVDDVC
jgi:hypothetical protein